MFRASVLAALLVAPIPVGASPAIFGYESLSDFLAFIQTEAPYPPEGCTPEAPLPRNPTILNPDLPAAERELVRARGNSLVGDSALCREAFDRRYVAAIRAYCGATCMGHYIGGGCDHIIGYSWHSGVTIAMLEECE